MIPKFIKCINNYQFLMKGESSILDYFVATRKLECYIAFQQTL